MTPEETLDWLAQQHFDQCREARPIQDWIRKMKSQLPKQEQGEPVAWEVSGKLTALRTVQAFVNQQVQDAEYNLRLAANTTQQQRTWVGLTDEEIDELHGSPMELEHSGALKWVRSIEAKLKEKNA